MSKNNYVFIVNKEFETKALKLDEIERKKKEIESDFEPPISLLELPNIKEYRIEQRKKEIEEDFK